MVVSDGIAFNADVGALYTLCSMYLIGVTGPLAPMRWNKEQWCSRSDMGWSVRHPPVTTTDSSGVFTSTLGIAGELNSRQLYQQLSTVVTSNNSEEADKTASGSRTRQQPSSAAVCAVRFPAVT